MRCGTRRRGLLLDDIDVHGVRLIGDDHHGFHTALAGTQVD
jgi:hypothetical protein